MWYLAYRRDGSTRMRVFKTKDLALRAASEMIGDRDDDSLEVGPMLAPRDGNVFKGDELRRMCDSDTVCTECGARSQRGTAKPTARLGASGEVRG